ncbi:uncharacterized protein [Equus caballus]|uniref:uncharacterized protein n=1 Tax=Equus caballus TaxID=9796 RepID=UPI0038B2A582
MSCAWSWWYPRKPKSWRRNGINLHKYHLKPVEGRRYNFASEKCAQRNCHLVPITWYARSSVRTAARKPPNPQVHTSDFHPRRDFQDYTPQDASGPAQAAWGPIPHWRRRRRLRRADRKARLRPGALRIEAFPGRRHASGAGRLLVPAHVRSLCIGRLDRVGLLVFLRPEKEQAAR